MSFIAEISAYLTVSIHAIWLLSLAAYLINRTPIGINTLLEGPSKVVSSFYREVSFTVALGATAGSLYFSEVMMLDPCPLCWYQRIFMYPLVILFLTAILMMRRDVQEYVVPLTIVGAGISTYHYAVQMLDEVISGCAAGAACEATHFMYFDYVTIPMMAFTAFVSIMIINLKFADSEEKEDNEGGFEDLYS